MGLTPAEVADILAGANELDYFADSLIHKRCRQVEKLLPETSRILGEEFRNAFSRFAPTFIPSSEEKYYEEAVAFCRWVEDRGTLALAVENTAVFERTRLLLYREGRRFSFCRLPPVSRDSAAKEVTQHRRGRFGLVFWARFGSRVIHYSI